MNNNLTIGGETRISWVPADAEPVDLTDCVSDLTFETDPSASQDWRPSRETQRFLVISARLLEMTDPYTIRLRGRLTWSGYRTLFDRPHPHSQRVKTEYHRRLRARGRRNR